MKDRLFIQLPQELRELVPEYAEYFDQPQLLQKSLYGTDIAAKAWNTDLTDWLTPNENMSFNQSNVNPSLYLYRNKENGDFYF